MALERVVEGGAVDLRTAATELYGVVPAEFVATRTRLAKDARAAGEKELATAIVSLPKPTLAAWAVNRLVRTSPDEVDELLALGAQMREAQASAAGQELRELARAQHRLLAAARRLAEDAAREAGQRLSEPIAQRVQATLHAGMADPWAAEAVRSGVLVVDLASTGLGPVDLTGAVAVADDGPARLGGADAVVADAVVADAVAGDAEGFRPGPVDPSATAATTAPTASVRAPTSDTQPDVVRERGRHDERRPTTQEPGRRAEQGRRDQAARRAEEGQRAAEARCTEAARRAEEARRRSEEQDRLRAERARRREDEARRRAAEAAEQAEVAVEAARSRLAEAEAALEDVVRGITERDAEIATLTTRLRDLRVEQVSAGVRQRHAVGDRKRAAAELRLAEEAAARARAAVPDVEGDR